MKARTYCASAFLVIVVLFASVATQAAPVFVNDPLHTEEGWKRNDDWRRYRAGAMNCARGYYQGCWVLGANDIHNKISMQISNEKTTGVAFDNCGDMAPNAELCQRTEIYEKYDCLIAIPLPDWVLPDFDFDMFCSLKSLQIKFVSPNGDPHNYTYPANEPAFATKPPGLEYPPGHPMLSEPPPGCPPQCYWPNEFCDYD